MKQDFDQLCEFEDDVMELALRTSADMISSAKNDTKKKEYVDVHTEEVGKYKELQKVHRDEYYIRGVRTGAIATGLLIIAGDIVITIIKANKK